MNVLILGGAGYIGSRLATALFDLDPSINIRCVDNLASGRLEVINHLHANPNFEFFLGNICDAELMWAMMADRQVIINCVKSSTHEEAVYNIIGGTQNILELLDENQQYIYISTYEVYHPWEAQPITELSATWVNDLTIAATISAEALTVAYQRQFGRNTLVLRVPGVYQEWADLLNSPLRMEILHIKDLADAILKAIKETPNGVLNLPTGLKIFPSKKRHPVSCHPLLEDLKWEPRRTLDDFESCANK